MATVNNQRMPMPGNASKPAPTTPPAAPPAPAIPTPPPVPPMPGPSGKAGGFEEFDVDLTDVQQNSFIIPDGDYIVTCIDVENGVSNAGNPQFIWTFAINGGEYNGREFKLFTALTPAAMWKVSETVSALGIGAAGSRVKFTRTDVIGRVCVATIEENTYNGNTRSSIVSVRPFIEE